jgi:hypothetical protein
MCAIEVAPFLWRIEDGAPQKLFCGALLICCATVVVSTYNGFPTSARLPLLPLVFIFIHVQSP